MTNRTCSIDGCDDDVRIRGMCKPHYRKDYYRRNKTRENASNKAYREANPEYWKSRWSDYAERRWGAERAERRRNLEERLASTHKACTQCDEHLPKVEFYEDPKRLDGCYSWCKACFKAHCRSAYDPEKDAERGARYRSTPEAKERDRERLRAWYAANPERAREQTRRYQARRSAATVEEVSYAAILERDGMSCHICDDEIPSLNVLHFDHVIPLSKGGAHSYDNIKPSHASCNLRKGAKILPAA